MEIDKSIAAISIVTFCSLGNPLTQEDVVSGLVRFRAARTVRRSLPLSYFVFEMSNGTAACNMLGVEYTIHSRPHPHCSLQRVPID